jgi:phosphatidylserine/phosphatidylglycerophosphate/cardiolipin synthase-like enzyme/uncharacterized membrane protein YdjX (TVP38/TMEM64 family)
MPSVPEVPNAPGAPDASGAANADRGILQPGRNCWRIEHAERLAFLVDGADFFRAFREAATRARHSLLIIGWDIDSRVDLLRNQGPPRRGKGPDGLPLALGAFLNALLKRNSQLHIHVLDWDFTVVFAPDREWMPLYKEEWTAHPRLHFHLDDQHPVGACHHQKVIVVDDRVAFVGGLDLTRGRWDTTGHVPRDARRKDLEGDSVPQPYHDIQMIVEGPVAAAAGDLARNRWRLATGETPSPPPPPLASTPESKRDTSPDGDPWPGFLAPDLEDAAVAISRTIPLYGGQKEVREVEQLLIDAIAAARKAIYIEAQYFTANKIGDALAKRLAEPEGPEVVLVLPERTDGWLSQKTMDVLRERLFKQLLAVDNHHRLRLYRPCIPGLGAQCVNVHSKITFIDDEFLRVGSANLNNRSMGLDTECDLAFEARGEPRIRSAISAFRSRLLAEHLGAEPAEIDARLAVEGSLIRAIDSINGGDRCLLPIAFRVTPEMDALVPSSEIVDPDHAVSPDQIVEEMIPPEQRAPARRHFSLTFAILAAVAALAAAWHWSPLRKWVNVETLTGLAADFAQFPAAPLFALGGFVAGGLVAFPLTVLIMVCILIFGPWMGFIYSLLGALLSASTTYAIGHFAGRDVVRRLAGKKLTELNRRLARRGLVTMILVRLLPVAPFSIVNLVAGASRIRFRDFVIGSAIGLLPGIVGISLFADRLAATIQKPDIPTFAMLAAVVAALIAGGFAFWHWEQRQRNNRLRAQTD